MPIIHNFYYFFILVAISIFLLFIALLPDIHVILDIWELLIILPLISFIFVPSIYRGKGYNWKDVNLGGLYFFTMAIIMVVGTINNFVVRAVYPTYGENISLTNYYWMGGMISFSIGFVLFKNRITHKNTIHKTNMLLSYHLIIFVFLMAMLGTVYSFGSLGFIPFFHGVGKGLRYTGDVASISIPVKLWSLNVISAIMCLSYLINIAKDKRILIILIVSFISSLFFIIRIYPFLIIVTLFLVVYFSSKTKRHFVLISIASIIFYSTVNVLFHDFRPLKIIVDFS